MEQSRYILTVDMYVYADDDKHAKFQSKKIVEELKRKDDNRAAIVSIEESPFGSLSTRKLEL